MSKFKVGDRVIVDKEEGIIVRTDYFDLSCPYLITYENGLTLWANSCNAKLVEEERKCDIGYETHYRLQDYINKQTIMSKITTFAKNLVLSSDEKLLRKYGLKNECGEFTDEAESLVMAKLIKENEAYLIELAKGMEAEEAKK